MVEPQRRLCSNGARRKVAQAKNLIRVFPAFGCGFFGCFFFQISK